MKSRTELNDITKRKILGEEPEWGRRRRAVVATGDNRSDSWERLGAHDCWIKLGENSIEALRQALLADEARIVFSQPELPSERITSLKIKSSLVGDQPLEIHFNEGFSAIIGGRGSGKSSILEYLRFGIARTVADFPSSETLSSGGKEQTLISDTLQEGFVEVGLYRDGVKETWRREWATRDHIKVTGSNGATTQLTVDEAQRRFRARAFYQKGLSTTVNDPTTAADQITGIAAAEALERRRALEQDIGKAHRAVTTALQQAAAHWQYRLEYQQAQVLSDDIQKRKEAATERLDKEGVSEDTKKVLEQAPLYSRAKSYLEELEKRISSAGTDIESIRDRMLTTRTNILQIATLFEEISHISIDTSKTRDVVAKHLNGAIAELNALDTRRQTALARFETRNTEFTKKYDTALALQASHTALIEESTKLARELEEALAKVTATAEAVRTSSAAVEVLADARRRINKLVSDRRKLLEDAADRVAGKWSKRLEAQVKNDPCPTEYVEALCKILVSSYVSDPESKVKQWIEESIKTNPESAWIAISESILSIYESKIIAGSPSEPNSEIMIRIKELFFGNNSLTPAQCKRVYANFDDSTVGSLLAATPRDFIHMRYIDDQDRRKPFSKASPGQQASALLELLLQQSAGTLIIDQPEDDLDNRVVMKIVDLIRISKNNRQLIFTTHNPNVVVNGDADKVIALDANDASRRPNLPTPEITIDADGAIETPEIRSAITKIMEGGEEAFELRRKKYNLNI